MYSLPGRGSGRWENTTPGSTLFFTRKPETRPAVGLQAVLKLRTIRNRESINPEGPEHQSARWHRHYLPQREVTDYRQYTNAVQCIASPRSFNSTPSPLHPTCQEFEFRRPSVIHALHPQWKQKCTPGKSEHVRIQIIGDRIGAAIGAGIVFPRRAGPVSCARRTPPDPPAGPGSRCSHLPGSNTGRGEVGRPIPLPLTREAHLCGARH
jgi:hypothetical protein